ncbi:TPA: hypothetical protein JLR01_004216 [Escherichia coli]|nr:hypothetical protein [Escherichia coli]HBB9798211.1 hypothetical protein [Escherichia coli]
MKILAQIILVTMIQFLSCYLAEWGGSEIVAILLFVLVWQILFIYLFYQIEKKRQEPIMYKFNKVAWYMLMLTSSLMSPLFTLMIFIGGWVIELKRISGCISIREWCKKQQANDSVSSELFLSNGCNESPEINYNPDSGYFVGYRIK